VHWWAWGKGAALFLAGVAFVQAGAGFLGAMLVLVGVLLAFQGLVVVATTELAVTDRRVIAKFGLVRRSTVELLHHKIEGLNVDQGVFGRILGFGTVTINGAGSGRAPIPHIAQPLDFRRSALEVIEATAPRGNVG
jgi:uncharacterized membrane protein YdbT with pleckstrin-like domain